MKYYSTNKISEHVSFKHALLKGLANDKGLFMPEHIPTLSPKFFAELKKYSFQEISFTIAEKFVDNEINKSDLQKIIDSAISFEAPLVNLSKQLNVLELFHGPTLAFKDFGARFMARTMEYFLKTESKEINVLVATSGDTGSAVANGFLGVEGINVIVLFPKGKVSKIQEKQITTLGNNITALEIEGTFDDCQRLVKMAFVDDEIIKKMNLSSANSINIGRLIPQSFYYFEGYKKIENPDNVVFSIPSGNLGNLTAGLIAKQMGLPVSKFIAATNSNNVFTEFIKSGQFNPRASSETISNAMDVGDPSNVARIIELYNNDHSLIKDVIFSSSYTDRETLEKINEINDKYSYIIDPHGAVGCLALGEYIEKSRYSGRGIVLETAHPSKFIDVFKANLKFAPQIPERLLNYLNRESESHKLSNSFKDFKEFLLG
jgi:threonine synthase